MIDRRIVRRYVAALFESAEREDIVDLVESDLGLITYTFESNSQLLDAMVSPMIPASKKRDIITGIFKDKIQDVALHYLYLLIDNRREDVIGETQGEYIRLANEARGVLVAEVTSAVELVPDEIGKLKEKLSAQTGKKIEISSIIDPSVIGGLIVRIGDKVFDGSISGELNRIRERFIGE